MRRYKYIIVLDTNNKFYVRRAFSSVHNIPADTMYYTCDKPLGNDLTLSEAIKVMNKAARRTTRKGRKR